MMEGGDLMTYGCYVNGEKRDLTKEEGQILMDRMMDKMGYKRADGEAENKKEKEMASA
jgi:hypothetical protein